jgi:hypothetical protein
MACNISAKISKAISKIADQQEFCSETAPGELKGEAFLRRRHRMLVKVEGSGKKRIEWRKQIFRRQLVGTLL